LTAIAAPVGELAGVWSSDTGGGESGAAWTSVVVEESGAAWSSVVVEESGAAWSSVVVEESGAAWSSVVVEESGAAWLSVVVEESAEAGGGGVGCGRIATAIEILTYVGERAVEPARATISSRAIAG
jgi:hypothetical protein